MLIRHAAKMSAEPVDINTIKILESVSKAQLYEWVKTISIPRHYEVQPQNNQWITQQLQSYGYQTQSQGKYANILTLPPYPPTNAGGFGWCTL